MSISGLFLILFLTIHVIINSLYIIGPDAFQAGCDFMALPIVTIIVPVLAAGFAIHIFYAAYLTWTNRKARGNDRYAVPNKAQTDSWAAKNMFVLGLIVFGVLALHLTHFWAKMQMQDFIGHHSEDPNMLMELTFKSPINLVIYLIWFAALWLHLTHGFWSALHTIGLDNKTWIKRLKIIALVYATILILCFTTVAIVAFLRANGICC